jgi:hypothetical protein
MPEIIGTSPRGRRTLIAIGILLVGLHLTKTGAFVAVGQPPLEGDARHYWNDAGRMVDGDWLMAQGDVETIRTPGYPFFLALLQLLFGRHALIAAAVLQQLMVLATAMLSGWMSARITRSWVGGACGLLLGLFCVSQNAVGDYLLSDTLFTFLLTLSFAALIAWFEWPSTTLAGTVGLLLGLATLVRPIAQFAWAPILVAMAFRLSADLKWRRYLIHGTCLLGIFAAVLAPWYARNYCYCGKLFLSNTAGLTLWKSIFKQSSGSRFDPAVPFAETPKTAAILAQLKGVDLQSHWDVLRALEKQGLTRMEAIDRMQETCMEAIRAHPWSFVDSRLRRFVWFWITPNGTRRPRTPDFHLFENTVAEEALPPGEYCGQAYWIWDGYYRDGKLNWLWHPNPWLYLSATGITACAVIAALRDLQRRPFAIAGGLLLAYFGVMTAVGAPPEYRYRMPLEPVMIVCVANLAASLAARWTGKPRIYAGKQAVSL